MVRPMEGVPSILSRWDVEHTNYDAYAEGMRASFMDEPALPSPELRQFRNSSLESSREFLRNINNYSLGTNRFGSAQDALNGQGMGGASTAGPLDAYFKSGQLAMPDFSSWNSAAASAASGASSTGSAGTKSTIEMKSAGDDEDVATSKDKKDFVRAIIGKGYSPDEANAIVKALSTATKDDKDLMKKAVSGGDFPDRKDPNWHQKFASWYAMKVGNKNAAEAADLVKEHVGAGDATVKLKRDTTIGGDHFRGAKVQEDCAATEPPLEKDWNLGWDPKTKKWHHLDDDNADLGVIEGLESAEPSKFKKGGTNDETIEATVKGEAKDDATRHKDAVSFMDYLNSKGMAPAAGTASAAEEAGEPAPAAAEKSVDAFTAALTEGGMDESVLKVTESEVGDKKKVDLEPVDATKDAFAAFFKTDARKTDINNKIKAALAKLPDDVELTFMGEVINRGNPDYHAQIQKILRDNEIITAEAAE